MAVFVKRLLTSWLPLGVLIGALSGLGAAAFYAFLQFCTEHILGGLTGHLPATLAGEGGFRESSGFPTPWLIPIVVAVGAFAGTVLVRWFAPEAAGHGTDAAIHAIHHDPAGTPARTGLVKLLASGLTIGSGGSGGSEGPAAQITASTASVVARLFRLPYERARTAVTVGLGAGVGAIFRAPLGGAILGAEVIYRSDVAGSAIVPGLIASAVAFVVFGLIHSFDPIFGTVADFQFSGSQLLLYPMLGLIAGLIGRLYIETYYATSKLFARPGRAIPMLLRPALAGLVVGAIGLYIPGVLGTGYGTAQHVLDQQRLMELSLWLLIAIPFAKILATSLSIGSGGSGGIFGPGVLIGAAIGAAMWRLMEPTGLMPQSPAPFIVAGIAAFVGSTTRSPIALIVMAVEATNNVSMLFPAMAATAVAYLTVGSGTLYRSQLGTRLDDPFGPQASPLPSKDGKTNHDVGEPADTAAVAMRQQTQPAKPKSASARRKSKVRAGYVDRQQLATDS